jgi:hypothetical protein
MQNQHSLVLLALFSALLTACQSIGVKYRFPPQWSRLLNCKVRKVA